MKNKILIICFSLILYSSCDPIFNIEFFISNQSSSEIEVIIPRDTIFIAPNTTELIRDHSGISHP